MRAIILEDQTSCTILASITAAHAAATMTPWGDCRTGKKVATAWQIIYQGRKRRIYSNTELATNYAYYYICVNGANKQVDIKNH